MNQGPLMMHVSACGRSGGGLEGVSLAAQPCGGGRLSKIRLTPGQLERFLSSDEASVPVRFHRRHTAFLPADIERCFGYFLPTIEEVTNAVILLSIGVGLTPCS